jgi:hypothetical protein
VNLKPVDFCIVASTCCHPCPTHTCASIPTQQYGLAGIQRGNGLQLKHMLSFKGIPLGVEEGNQELTQVLSSKGYHWEWNMSIRERGLGGSVRGTKTERIHTDSDALRRGRTHQTFSSAQVSSRLKEPAQHAKQCTAGRERIHTFSNGSDSALGIVARITSHALPSHCSSNRKKLPHISSYCTLYGKHPAVPVRCVSVSVSVGVSE